MRLKLVFELENNTIDTQYRKRNNKLDKACNTRI